jgi:hypothetical protein
MRWHIDVSHLSVPLPVGLWSPYEDLNNDMARGALGGIRTPNLLIRSQMLYPLSYERLAPR